jgi:hypothetical protein
LYFGEEVAQPVAWGATWRDVVPGPSYQAELRARAAGFHGVGGARLASGPVAGYCRAAAHPAAGSLSSDGGDLGDGGDQDDGCDDDCDNGYYDCL